jgi:hypothetical protein
VIRVGSPSGHAERQRRRAARTPARRRGPRRRPVRGGLARAVAPTGCRRGERPGPGAGAALLGCAVPRTGPVDDGPPQYVAFSRDGARAYGSRAPPSLRCGCPTATPPRCRRSTAGQTGGRGRSPAAGICTGARRTRSQGRRCAHRRTEERRRHGDNRQRSTNTSDADPVRLRFPAIRCASPTPQWTGPLLRWTMGRRCAPLRKAEVHS